MLNLDNDLKAMPDKITMGTGSIETIDVSVYWIYTEQYMYLACSFLDLFYKSFSVINRL